MAEFKMPDINCVIIAGNLIKDPTFRKTTSDVPVANFTIASNRKFKDSSGRIKEDVCFIGIVAWYKLAESCKENLHKGSAVLVEGELQSRSFANEDGTTRSWVEIKARRIQFLNRRDHTSDDHHGHVDSYEDEDHPHPHDDDEREHTAFAYQNFMTNK
ncbi:MAG: single-stranded DNA-binding protein [Calditrichaeota bacterium]|nr:single-stranded DNA-binding protein [Calditrichota bacterium]MCB9366849.1 single-stranded DNA-binding protein [Calditrichota bacterium]